MCICVSTRVCMESKQLYVLVHVCVCHLYNLFSRQPATKHLRFLVFFNVACGPRVSCGNDSAEFNSWTGQRCYRACYSTWLFSRLGRGAGSTELLCPNNCWFSMVINHRQAIYQQHMGKRTSPLTVWTQAAHSTANARAGDVGNVASCRAVADKASEKIVVEQHRIYIPVRCRVSQCCWCFRIRHMSLHSRRHLCIRSHSTAGSSQQCWCHWVLHIASSSHQQPRIEHGFAKDNRPNAHWRFYWWPTGSALDPIWKGSTGWYIGTMSWYSERWLREAEDWHLAVSPPVNMVKVDSTWCFRARCWHYRHGLLSCFRRILQRDDVKKCKTNMHTACKYIYIYVYLRTLWLESLQLGILWLGHLYLATCAFYASCSLCDSWAYCASCASCASCVS